MNEVAKDFLNQILSPIAQQCIETYKDVLKVREHLTEYFMNEGAVPLISNGKKIIKYTFKFYLFLDVVILQVCKIF